MRNLYCIVGPSASGKTVLAKNLAEKYGLRRVRSYTTRKPRHTSETDYVFVTDKEFDELPVVYAYGEYAGSRYGVPPEEINNCDIYILEPTGLDALRQEYADRNIVTIFLDAPEAVRRLRLQERGTGEDEVKRRLAVDAEAFDGMNASADIVYSVMPNRGIVDMADDIYFEICTHEASTESALFGIRHPNYEIMFFPMWVENDVSYSWFNGESYSALFPTLSETVADAEKYATEASYRLLYEFDKLGQGALFLRCAKVAVPLHQKYMADVEGDHVGCFHEQFPDLDFDALNKELTVLERSTRDPEKWDAIYEAYSSIVFLHCKYHHKPILR